VSALTGFRIVELAESSGRFTPPSVGLPYAQDRETSINPTLGRDVAVSCLGIGGA
jgi:hypothetical protein